jgi:hypothetical protein
MRVLPGSDAAGNACHHSIISMIGYRQMPPQKRTASFALAIHYFVAFGIVTTYFVVSRRAALLRRHWVVCGLLYGIVAYGVMNLVVIPLSAIGPTPFSLPVSVNGIAIHMFGIGIPAAWFASRVPPAQPAV